jgi:ribosome-binding factor A
MAERRPARVAHLVQSELASLLLRDAKDPRLQQVTVTAVRMTPDLRVAHIFFRTLGAGDADGGTRRALERAAPFLRGEIGRSLGLRLTPELRFEYDTTPDTAQRLEDLLRGRRGPDDESET